MRTLASQRWAGRVAATRIAALAECAKEADLPSIDPRNQSRLLDGVGHAHDPRAYHCIDEVGRGPRNGGALFPVR